MDPITLRVLERFIKGATTPASRAERILEEIPAQLEAAIALNKSPVENGKKLPKTKLNARIDAYIDNMHKLLMEHQEVVKATWKATSDLSPKEKAEAERYLSTVQQLVPPPQQVKLIAKESKPAELRTKFEKAIAAWRRVGAMLAGQRMLFARRAV